MSEGMMSIVLAVVVLLIMGVALILDSVDIDVEMFILGFVAMVVVIGLGSK